MELVITETPIPPAEVVEQATKVIDAFNSLGFGLAALFVIFIALAILALVIWSGRNSSSTAISVLANSSLQKDKDIADLKAQREQEHKQHIDAMAKLEIQGTRANDLSAEANKILIAVNDRGKERDEAQSKLANDIHEMVNAGSKPVQEILSRVQIIAEGVARIDTRTADWSALLDVLTPLLVELGALRMEAKKHSTQPLPAITEDKPK